MLTNQTLTLASANLFNFVEPPNAFYQFDNIYEREQWLDKCHWTEQQLTTLNADIIGLQEVFSIEAAKSLMNQMGYPYFATVDTPMVEDEYIFSLPVVAVASRYPFKRVRAVQPCPSISQSYQVIPPAFSRQPIFCIIDVPIIGEVSIYVCHLKSQRATESIKIEDEQPLVGKWLSAQQRGWEAVMLRLFMQQQYQQKPMPTALMGDFNQCLSSDTLAPLVSPIESDDEALTLTDCWDLQTSVPTHRPATHYHFSTGNVLDYILLSQEFQTNSCQSLADVIDVNTLDQHLINPNYEQDKNASDHAFISATLRFVL
ncbi:endonuclease/exonuclease/phosphatase family protein [Vibrio sp. JPW-9-11-11]|uniref:endonuclease/exonuclease/phosphatase family protein n=1 Tax=Vibrio sp. JPW-9-11-11 TaxID=1416532 RepID=UPI00159385B6|nr:endonuclease/exonuclease/phosphatase family protein [Vibrio sp. JPW-9-11-11]NVD08479.1 endonuclease/exonuclease/phosphatase family protein [Vibrio sp. JPW-9-11-11]